MSKPQAHILIIDTEQYAGNFERDLCAYITGQTGECGVGAEYSLNYEDDFQFSQWWGEHIVHMPDDEEYPCHRPCAIWATPGWFNNGMGSHYRDTPENEVIATEVAIEAMKAYHYKRVEAAKKRIVNQDFETTQNGWTEEACLHVLEQYDNDMERMKTLHKAPAYQSVAIFVNEMPPEDVWKDFIKRAHEFAQAYEEIEGKSINLTITGFRQEENNQLQHKKKLFL